MRTSSRVRIKRTKFSCALPSEICFLVDKKFLGPLEIPFRDENMGEFVIMLATDILYEEFLVYGSSSVESYLLGCDIENQITNK